MNEKVYSRLRYPRIIGIIIFGFIGGLFDYITYRVITGLEETTIVETIIILAITLYSNYRFIKNIIYFVKPGLNPIAKKYGGIENLEKIVKEINSTIVYKNKQVIISENYISSTGGYRKIVHLDDVINAYQHVMRTNGVVTSRDIVIINKEGKEIFLGYNGNEAGINEILSNLVKVRNDIKIGYIR